MPDRLVQVALSNWGPRFTSNGVDPADFARIASSIDSWSDWCRTWSNEAKKHEVMGRKALESERSLSAGFHLSMASVYYHFAKFLFVCDPEQMRTAHDNAVRCCNDALGHLSPSGLRVEIPYPGRNLAGILRIPSAGSRPHPAVVLISGLDSTKEEFRLVERTFLNRGMATLSVDGPGQGELEYDLPIEADWSRPGKAIMDWLQGRSDIDGDRVGIWGVSLGGYYSARWASEDSRVRACVSLSGTYNFGDAWKALPQLSKDAFILRSHSADETSAAAAAGELSLENRAEHISCPLLVIVGKKDALFDWETTSRIAREASGPSELLAIDGAGHGCANYSYAHRPYCADWMADKLLAR